MELLKEAVPKIGHPAILYEDNPASEVKLKEVKATAHELGLIIQPVESSRRGQFERVFAALNKERPDGLYVVQGTVMSNNQKRTVAFALKSKLPSMYNRREDVEAGAFISYGAHSYRLVAIYVNRILKGANPADLPFEQPKKFELAINSKPPSKSDRRFPLMFLQGQIELFDDRTI